MKTPAVIVLAIFLGTFWYIGTSPARAQQVDIDQRLDQIDQRLQELQQEPQHWWDYFVSHDWVDPGTFYFVLALSAYGLYRFRRAQQERRYEYVTYVLNVPLRCQDGRSMPDHLVDDHLIDTDGHNLLASHGLVTGILREDKLEFALDKKQLRQLDTAARSATPEGFLALDHDMFAMFRTEISEIFNRYFMRWERHAETLESAVFRRMYFSVLYENYTDRKHVRILIIPADRLADLPQGDLEDATTVIRSRKLRSRLPNLRFMRDEMQRVDSGEVDKSPYVRTFEIMDQRK